MGWRLDDGDELCDISEVAERLGRPVRTVESWRSRYAGAPEPVNAPPGSPRGRHLYRLSDWLRFAADPEEP